MLCKGDQKVWKIRAMKEDFTIARAATNINLLSAYNVRDAFPIQPHTATLTNWVEIK